MSQVIIPLVLPPKRFQRFDDPKYDPIRFRPWFRHLEERRAKIPNLAQAFRDWHTGKSDQTQKAVADKWAIDERELRDYEAFALGHSKFKRDQITPELRAFQAMLDDSYLEYCVFYGAYNIRSLIESMAPKWGKKARHVIELWEVDPEFYPTNYQFK